MKIPQHIFIDPQGPLTGAGFILCTQQPFYIGKVYKFKTEEEREIVLRNANDWNYCSVPGYRVTIFIYTSLLNNNNKGAIKEALQQMANYYLTEKINIHAAAFTKFKKG